MDRLIEFLKTHREAFIGKLKMRIQYFNDYSSLPGVGHVISLSPTSVFKRLFWLGTITACCYGSAAILSAALGIYSQDAVSYSVETDYLEWDTRFPAVTICEAQNELKTKAVMLENNYTKNMVTFAKDIAFWNKNFCKSCINCKMNESCIEHFQPILNIVRNKCEDLLSLCSFADEEFPCCDRFRPLATEYGECFSFNSDLTGHGGITINRKVGLPTLKFTAINSKITIKVHSPEERVTVLSEKTLSNCETLFRGMELEVNLVVEETVNDASVRSIAQGSRDCLFKDEWPPEYNGWPFHEYSYSNCLWYCRSMEQYQLCNCTYHFTPKISKVPVCNIDGLKCLYRNKDSLQGENCECPMSCVEDSYSVVFLSCTMQEKAQVTQGSIKIGQLPHLRVRRQAIRDMLGLVVDIGGVVGVFFGASLLSFIEIVYIFCMRKYP